MKSCPSCRQTYPDDAPDFCTNDGTPLVFSASEYGSGSAGYRWQSGGGGQYPPPPTGWQPPPQNWGQPPAQHAPYGYQMPYPPSQGGGGGVATAALYTGIGTIAALLLGFVLIISAVNTHNYNLGQIQFGGILILLSLIAGLTALILGIVAISMSNRNPAISKAKGIVGLCLGAIPLLLMIVGLIGRMR